MSATTLALMWISVAFVAVVAVANVAPPKPLSAEAVEAHIRKHGGRSAIDRFFSCDESGDAAYAKIQTGDKRWLAIAVRLQKDSDACVTTSLLSSIGAALPNAPGNVLPLVDTQPLLAPSEMCLPFMSDDEEPKKQMRYLLRVENVLIKFKTPSL